MSASQATEKPSEKQTEKKPLIPDKNEISISTQKTAKYFIFIAKIFLKKFEEVDLTSLGNATETAVQVAENLSR